MSSHRIMCVFISPTTVAVTSYDIAPQHITTLQSSVFSSSPHLDPPCTLTSCLVTPNSCRYRPPTTDTLRNCGRSGMAIRSGAPSLPRSLERSIWATLVTWTKAGSASCSTPCEPRKTRSINGACRKSSSSSSLQTRTPYSIAPTRSHKQSCTAGAYLQYLSLPGHR